MTKLAKLLLWLIIIILLIGAGFYFSKKDKTIDENVSTPIAVESPSIKGCYVAHLAKDTYTLSILSEKGEIVSGILAYNNYEKDSSSGPLEGTFKDGILLGNYSFDSEGMHSNRQVVFKKEGNSFIQGFGESKTVGDRDVFVDVTKVTYDPKSTFAKSENCIEHFADSNNTFSFDYNSFFKAIEGNSKLATTDWRQNNVKDKGVTLANVYVSKAFMPQTNFSDVRLGIGRSTDATAIKNCLVYAEENKDNKSPSPAEVTISGHPFKKFVSGDAGASNFYETTSYRGIVDGDCYAIEYTIHSTSLAAYSPDQGIKQFDHSKIQGEIEKIVKSFKFLVNSN